jgi:hypothetical protein
MHLPQWIINFLDWIFGIGFRMWCDDQYYTITYWILWAANTAYSYVSWVINTAYSWVNWLINTGYYWIVWVANTAYDVIAWVLGTAYGWVRWLAETGYYYINWIATTVYSYIEWFISTAYNYIVWFIEAGYGYLYWLWESGYALVQSLVQGISDIWSWIEATVGKLWAGIEDVWNGLVALILENYDKLVSYADDLYEYLSSYTWNRISELWDQINAIWADIVQWREELLKWVQFQINSLTASLEHIFLFLEDAFEDAWTLTENTVVGTFTKYGIALWSILLSQILRFPTEEEIEQIGSLHIGEEIEKHLDLMNKGKDGAWADVSQNIDIALEAMNRNEDPPDLSISDKLLTPGERAERDRYQAEVESWTKYIP